ncbi:MAG: hypothetical protein M0P58_01155 [Bacteroidales bacterium]|nr:hypothetical protein [Bacteroidales bacterium]
MPSSSNLFRRMLLVAEIASYTTPASANPPESIRIIGMVEDPQAMVSNVFVHNVSPWSLVRINHSAWLALS